MNPRGRKWGADGQGAERSRRSTATRTSEVPCPSKRGPGSGPGDSTADSQPRGHGPLLLDGNVFGWTVDDRITFEILDTFTDGGLNAVDTPDVDSVWVPGNRGSEPEKGGPGHHGRVGKGPRKKGFSDRWIARAVEASLRQLRTDPEGPIAETQGAQPSEVALAWLVARAGVTAPIANATSRTQMESLVKAVGLVLSATQISGFMGPDRTADSDSMRTLRPLAFLALLLALAACSTLPRATPGRSDNPAVMGPTLVPLDRFLAIVEPKNPSYGPAGWREIWEAYRDACGAEGVDQAVALAQLCLETNYLKFGGTVQPSQNNFAGLGVTGGGVRGLSFPDVRTGALAHVEHLKAYGSTEPLASPQVDPRFRYVVRGSAPTVRDLAGKWAADPKYGEKLTALWNRLAVSG